MTAALAPAVIQQSVAAEHIAKIRAILSGEEMTPEQAALSHWWNKLRRFQRSALFLLAGINYGSVEKKWADLPTKQRAALVLAAQAFADNMQGITSTLKSVRQDALATIKKEARTARKMPTKAAA